MSATVATVDEQKADLRRELRARRKGLPDRSERSATIVRRLQAFQTVAAAGRAMVYSSLPGEPDLEPLAAWCRAEGKDVLVPEAEPNPSWPDLVVVPGVAFTRTGDRLGQGGGWYDRFLVRTRPGCIHVGVAFDFQLLDAVPSAPHDVRLHGVVTDAGAWWCTKMRIR